MQFPYLANRLSNFCIYYSVKKYYTLIITDFKEAYMYELYKLGDKTYYIDSPVKTGIYTLDDGDVLLVDSGNDVDAAKKIDKHLRENNWIPKIIINTHSHADHIGGNDYFVKKYGTQIFSVGMECSFISNPLLEPAYLYGGFPFKELKNKFLMAKPSDAIDITAIEPSDEYDQIRKLLQANGIEIIKLDGHSFNMIGVKTSDDAFFIGDAINGINILDKYHITFIYDVKSYLETLDFLLEYKSKVFVPSHSVVSDNIMELVNANKNKAFEIMEHVIKICEKPKIFENILKEIFYSYSLKMDINQYVLVGSTLKSYLSYLYTMGKLEYVFENNEMLWVKI